MSSVKALRVLLIASSLVASRIHSSQPSDNLSFAYSPNIQEWVVPENGSPFFVRAWGAGGGAESDFSGGAGGYASGYLWVPPGSVIKIVVGTGGLTKDGEASALYLNSVAPENALLIAAGGSSGKTRSAGTGGALSFSDSRYVTERLFLAGEDGGTRSNAKPRYNCSRDYQEGIGEGRYGKKGGNGLITISRSTQDFCYTGSEQTFTVPGGVSSITVEAWGGGGGGSRGIARFVGSGAGYATRTMDVTAGDTLAVLVAGGGQRAFASQSAAYGGGGVGAYQGALGAGSGGGGGATHFFREVLTGAGGGGAGGGVTDGGFIPHPITGVGGSTTGGTGGSAVGGGGGSGGTGGSQTAGGTGGVYMGDGTSYPGVNGSKYTGGCGHFGNSRPGGGGGGGYYGGGGGGGGYSGVDSGGGGGGGGSSFPSTGAIAGSGQIPPNSNNVYLPDKSGRGGNTNSRGYDGFIYFTW